MISGCTFSPLPRIDSPLAPQTPISTIRGSAYGGRQPIAGAHIYLFAAGTTGYGGNSTSLLLPEANTVADTNGNYYATTDSNGNFNIGGEYTCTQGTFVYMYAIGGDPGAGLNSGAGLMAALGMCPASGNLAQQVPYLQVNEVSTIAMAYALAGFAVDPQHVAHSGTTLAQTGITNASNNVSNIVSTRYGQAYTTTQYGGGATVPVAKIYTLANILAACINSSGPASTQCSTLFAKATLDGTSTGTKPTDTAAAAINMAHFPGANVSAIFNLQQSIGAPFAPALSTVPNDLTLSVTYTGAGMGNAPHLAIDSTGNVWTTPDGSSVVTKISPVGLALSGSSGITGTGLAASKDIAINANNDAVALGSSSSTVLFLTTYSGIFTSIPSSMTGGASHTFTAHPLNVGIALDGSGNMQLMDSTLGNLMSVSPAGSTIGTMLLGGLSAGTNYAAVDTSGSVWSTNGSNSLSKFSSGFLALSLSSGFTGGGLNSPSGIALDAGGNVWVANSGANSISEFNASGVAVSSSAGFTGGGLNKPVALAQDGNGRVWVANSGANTISAFTTSGTAVSGTSAYTDSSLNKPNSIAVDGSGNVWVGSSNAAGVTVFLGAAAPVVTPLAYAVKNGVIATRP